MSGEVQDERIERKGSYRMLAHIVVPARDSCENVKSAGRAHVRLLCYVLLVQLLRTPIEMEVCVCVCVCVCVREDSFSCVLFVL